MSKEKRIKLLQNLGIISLTLISMYYFSLLFGAQLSLLLRAINTVLLPFGIALFISYLLAPIMKLLEKKLKITKRWINVVIVLLILILFIAVLFYTIGDIVYTQATEFFINDWDRIVISIEGFIEENTFLQGVLAKIIGSFESVGEETDVFSVLNIFRGIISVTVTIVLVPVFLVFILHDKDTIFNGILRTVPAGKVEHLQELGKRANSVIEKYFNGRFLSMLILGILSTFMLLLFGFSIDKAIFFGFTLGFLDIIPYVGGFIGIMLPVLFSFTVVDQLMFAEYTFVALIVANIVLQFLQGNVIQPYIMGKEVNLHPLLVLTSFLFFGALFGITGVILAIPITGTIISSLDYYKEVKNG